MSLASLKLAVRVLLRRKVFTAISLFGVTITLLVLVLVSALMDGLLAPRVPESNAARTLTMAHARLIGENARASGPPGLGLIEPVVRGLPGDPLVTVYHLGRSEDAWIGGKKVSMEVKRTDAAFWTAHDFRFVEGRPFGADEDAAGSAVAVISEEARDRLFGDGSALGRTFELDGRAFRVIGVVETVSSLRLRSSAGAWLPFSTLPQAPDPKALLGNFAALVIPDDARDIPALRAEMQARIARVPVTSPDYDTIEAPIETQAQAIAREMLPTDPGDADPAGRVRAIVIVLSLAFMFLPALNLVTMTMSRVLERAPEIGVRKAFGATRSQLVLQFVLENVLLTLVGGALALILAPLVIMGLSATGIGLGPELRVSFTVLLQGLAFAVAFGVLSGAWPAWRMSRLPPVDVLRGRTA